MVKITLNMIRFFLPIQHSQQYWECSSAGGTSDRHIADAGSIPRCGEGFFSQSQLSVQTLLRVSVHHPCGIAYINICVHVKDPVVHVRARWIMETLKHSSCTLGWVAQVCRSWLSLGKATEFPMGEIPLRLNSCKKKKKKRSKNNTIPTLFL